MWRRKWGTDIGCRLTWLLHCCWFPFSIILGLQQSRVLCLDLVCILRTCFLGIYIVLHMACPTTWRINVATIQWSFYFCLVVLTFFISIPQRSNVPPFISNMSWVAIVICIRLPFFVIGLSTFLLVLFARCDRSPIAKGLDIPRYFVRVIFRIGFVIPSEYDLLRWLN